MDATFALYPSDIKIISFFKRKMFHITWGKTAVKLINVAILAKDQRPKQSLMQGNEDLVFCKTQCSEAQMSRWANYLKCSLGLQGFFKSIFRNLVYIHT